MRQFEVSFGTKGDCSPLRHFQVLQCRFLTFQVFQVLQAPVWSQQVVHQQHPHHLVMVGCCFPHQGLVTLAEHMETLEHSVEVKYQQRHSINSKNLEVSAISRCWRVYKSIAVRMNPSYLCTIGITVFAIFLEISSIIRVLPGI